MPTFDKLKGHKVESISINEEQDVMRFELGNGGILYYSTVGDCCNRVWYADMDMPDYLIGGTVVDTWESAWKRAPEEEDEFEVLDKAFWTIQTNKGHCTLEVRNSHNGYYGGEIIELDGYAEDDDNAIKWIPVGQKFECTLDKILGV